jgi:hypothetical protein
MRCCRSSVVVACVAAVVGLATVSSHGALARQRVGGTAPIASYSATQSRNVTIRQQQLICDPPEPTEGSTSVEYEPGKVTLSGFAYGPGYGPQPAPGGPAGVGVEGIPLDLLGFVEVFNGGERFLQRLTDFLAQPAGTETGYVQVYYQLLSDGKAGQITPFGPILDEDPGLGAPGEGVDTHQFLFDLLDDPTVPGPATYHVYADDGNRGLFADVLRGISDEGDPFTVTSEGIHDATVTAPEPSGLCVMGLASLALLGRGRRR